MYSRTWSCFAAQSVSHMVNHIEKTLVKSKYNYHKQQGPPRFILDSEHPSTVFSVHELDNLQLRVYHVSNDPFARFFTRFFSSKQNYIICFLEIYPVNKTNQKKVSLILSDLACLADIKLWDIDHPRFRVAWLLRWRNKMRWQQYLSYSK